MADFAERFGCASCAGCAEPLTIGMFSTSRRTMSRLFKAPFHQSPKKLLAAVNQIIKGCWMLLVFWFPPIFHLVHSTSCLCCCGTVPPTSSHHCGASWSWVAPGCGTAAQWRRRTPPASRPKVHLSRHWHLQAPQAQCVHLRGFWCCACLVCFWCSCLGGSSGGVGRFG